MSYEIDGVMYGMISRYEKCPYCDELMWVEMGYFSYEEMLLWDYYYYKVYSFPVSHYRDVE